MICPICKNTDCFLRYPANLDSAGENYLITDGRFGVHGNLYQCRRCKLVWLADDNLVSRVVLSYSADSFDEIYEMERENRKKTAEVLIKKIKKIKPSGKLLDIGCYSGAFLEAAQQNNYEIFGIEASTNALSVAAQKISGDLRAGMAEEVLGQFPDEYFDIITLLDVIEHLQNPSQILALIKTKLKNDGLLVFSTPDAASLLARLQGGNWHALLPHHLYYFSVKNLKILLSSVAWQPLRFVHVGRHFTADYLAQQLSSISRPLSVIFGGIIKIIGIKKLTLPINLFDQSLIFAKKK
jgi:2-polyprenyl-3-methyl-5-hydroxy-6-metoxy-1,4-benzoquinol methylase